MPLYRSIDLFAGIGGIRMGFDQAFGDEIETVFVSEWDEKARETYEANFGNEPVVHGDITHIDARHSPSLGRNRDSTTIGTVRRVALSSRMWYVSALGIVPSSSSAKTSLACSSTIGATPSRLSGVHSRNSVIRSFMLY